jgi:hypothetical protein
VWLSMLEVMESYTPDELLNLKAAARQFLGGGVV